MTFSKSKIFLIFCITFIIGVFLGRFINYEIMAIMAMIFIIVGTIGWGNKAILIFAIAGVVALGGAWRFMTDYRQNDLQQFYGEKITVTGVILDEPDERSDKTFLTLSDLRIDNQDIESKSLLSVGRFPTYEYGQKINFEGRIQEPKEFDDFSYKNYLSRFGIDAVVYNPKVLGVEGNHGNKIKAVILKFKKKFTENLSQMLPEPQNAFLSGILLGAKRSIPEDLMDKFNVTGTSHIVALSGFNITIIAYGLDLLLRRFRKRISFLLSLIAIVLFVIATGASASVVRAGVMGGLVLAALNIGRVYAITNALAFTAAVMLIFNPQILLFDVGFQLSFLALMGLVYLMPILEEWDLRMPKVMKTALLATIAAQIVTLPILLINFERLSIVAPIVNLLVLGIIPVIMFFGFLAGLVSFIVPIAGIPFAWISWAALTYVIKVVEFFASVPLAAVSIHVNWWFGGVYYLILIAFMLNYYRREQINNLFSRWKPKPKTSLSI
jgi:competence protein ComEC